MPGQALGSRPGLYGLWGALHRSGFEFVMLPVLATFFMVVVKFWWLPLRPSILRFYHVLYRYGPIQIYVFLIRSTLGNIWPDRIASATSVETVFWLIGHLFTFGTGFFSLLMVYAFSDEVRDIEGLGPL
jgi:hypothetical protein